MHHHGNKGPPLRPEDVSSDVRAIRRVASAMVRDWDDASDIVQETWLALARKPPDRQPPPASWIARVIGNLIRLRARADGRREHWHSLAALEADASSASPETLLERAQLLEAIVGLLFELDEPFRSTLLMRFYKDLSTPEISRALGVPEGTVRWRIKIGLDRMRARMGDRNLRCLVPLLAGARKRPTIMQRISGRILAVPVTAALVLALPVVGWLRHRGVRRQEDPRTVHSSFAKAANTRLPPRLVAPLAPEVTGEVVDPQGTPVDGALVAIVPALVNGACSWSDRLLAAQTTHTTNGRFAFAHLTEGGYTLSASHADWTSTALTGVGVKEGHSTGVRMQLGNADAIIYGRIRDESGVPAGTRVAAIPYADGAARDLSTAYVTTPDEAGRFTLALRAGNYQILARAAGHLGQHEDRLISGKAEINFLLPAGQRVSGRVVQTGTQQALVNAAVFLRDKLGVTLAHARTDQDGRFAFGNVLAGSYQVDAKAGGLMGGWGRRLIVDYRSEVPPLLIEVAPGPRLRTKVRDLAGVPVAGARVRVRSLRSASSSGDQADNSWPRAADRCGAASAVSVDGNGESHIEGLEPGAYRVCVSAPGFASREEELVLSAADAEVQISLEPGASLRGRVINADATPVAAARMLLRSSAGARRLVEVLTDAKGHFEAPGLPPGLLAIHAVRDGLTSEERELALSPGKLEDVELRLPKGTFVSGHVRWQSGGDAGGAIVAATSSDDRMTFTRAAGDGRYRLGPLSPGDVTVTAFFPSSAPEEMVRKVMAHKLRDRRQIDHEARRIGVGATDVVGADLALTRADRRIAGLVVDPDGTPLAGARISGEPISSRAWITRLAGREQPYTVRSGPDGRFLLEDLPGGTVVVRAKFPGYPTVEVEDAEADTPVRLQFVTGALIAGRVVDGAGRPCPRFRVIARPASGDETLMMRQSRNGPGGAFELRLAPGSYELAVMPADRRLGHGSMAITVRPEEEKHGLEIRLVAADQSGQ